MKKETRIKLIAVLLIGIILVGCMSCSISYDDSHNNSDYDDSNYNDPDYGDSDYDDYGDSDYDESDYLYYEPYDLDMGTVIDTYTFREFISDSVSLMNQALGYDGENVYFQTWSKEQEEHIIRIRRSEDTVVSGEPTSDMTAIRKYGESGILYSNDWSRISLGFDEISDTSNLTGKAFTNEETLNKAKYYMIAAMIVLSTSEFASDADNNTDRFYQAYDWAKTNYESLQEGKAKVHEYSTVKIHIQKDAFIIMKPEPKDSESEGSGS